MGTLTIPGGHNQTPCDNGHQWWLSATVIHACLSGSELTFL